MALAPVILFVYNRPEHTIKTLKALKENTLAKETILYIFADGPKKDADDTCLINILATRDLIKSDAWCGTVHIIEKIENQGLADSIVSGVSEIVARHRRVIVLEDDIVTSKGFLKYMNNALDLYENNEKVMHISGYMYPLKLRTSHDTFFCNILSCWGWATWDRAWKYFNPDVNVHLKKFKDPQKRMKFNIEGDGGFYYQLERNLKGEIYTWAVKWYASWLGAGGYSLFPSKSLVKNIGHDGTGINSVKNSWFETSTADFISVDKQLVVENKTARTKINSYYAYMKYGKNWKLKKIKKRIRSRLNSIKRRLPF